MRSAYVALLAAGAEHVHLAGEGDRESRKTLRHTQLVSEDAARTEFQVLHLARRGDPVMRGAGDGQSRLGQQFGREMSFPKHQGEARREGGITPCQQLLALDVKLRIETVVLIVLVELCER